jgi:phenylacetic acid degradation operon negative regulatory protein
VQGGTPLATAVAQHLAANPQPPVWSLIATVFGDMAVMRGGTLSTEGLIRILGLVGIAAPAVRTALSRLVADGWLEGSREGRRSSYRMTPRAERETAAASRRIYALPQRDFDGRFDIVLIVGGTAAERQAHRAMLAADGFGACLADCFVRPSGPDREPAPTGRQLAALVEARPVGDAAALAAAAYDFAGMAARHGAFLEACKGLALAAEGADSEHAAALAARLLLIHGWRRLVLRDPALPLPLLPQSLRARPAADVMAQTYLALYQASEAGLDALMCMDAAEALHAVRFGRNM